MWFRGVFEPGGVFCTFVIIGCMTSLLVDGNQLNRGEKPRKKMDIRVGVLLPGDNDRLFSIQKVILAIQYAFLSERVRSLLPNCEFTLYNGDSKCNSIRAPVEAFNMLHVDKVHVIFGPVCDYSLAPVARYAPTWDTPVISPGGMAKDFGDGSEYPLLTRVGFKFPTLAQMFEVIFNRYHWNNIKILYSADGHSEIANRFCYLAMRALESQLISDKIQYDKSSFEYDEETEDIDQLLLGEVGVQYSIIVLCTSPKSVRNIMIRAAELNFDNGDYVFFNVDLFSSEEKLQKPWYQADDTEERNAKARRAYEVLVTLTLKHPETAAYRKFSESLKARSMQVFKRQVFGAYDDGEVNTFVGCFYDGVVLFAMGLNKTLSSGFSVRNGTATSRNMWNRSFEGITGTVRIDEHGDRQFDYEVLDMNPETGLFEIVADYHSLDKWYEVKERDIHWGGSRKEPPASRPLCGYDKSLCPSFISETFPRYMISIVILSSLVVSMTLAAVFLYRHYKREAKLAEISWKIRWDDIMFGLSDRWIDSKRCKISSSTEERSTSLLTVYSGDTEHYIKTLRNGRHPNIKTGYYKGSLVAITRLKKPVNVTKPLLIEFSQMLDVQHEHVVRFIGVCSDSPNQCVVTEYCIKGSLQGILERSDVKLDSIFKFSMIQDIVRGMSYLHASPIRSHGNLNSSNCVVDSRFVVKITNFGLHSLRSRHELIEDGSYLYHRGLLWTAPELLRLDEDRPAQGTQKGDVYSFAIICQEIVYRRGPFWIENKNYTPQDIYQLVRVGRDPNTSALTRPTLHAEPQTVDSSDGCSEELYDIITRSWSEDPAERPDFHSLTVKRAVGRYDTNDSLLDNLLSRMEQYAQNLEALVEERTTDYLEQKQRAENLLYTMLPRYVANQLLCGQTVEAEKFECITLSFSDICGFTKLSAASKPMEIVDMLNDLYTLFDSILDRFEVYKVETIGDAYMVASGLPVRNGVLHAHEIARMSLALIDSARLFKIRHRPNESLRLRIGIHTGPVCAGVVGVVMPRYCLFGDTVNTASRMESYGEPMKIHVSAQTKEILDIFGNFVIESRGVVSMKGKGDMQTYWLISENDTAVSTSGRCQLSSSPIRHLMLTDIC